MLQNRRVLVTGGAGFVGSHLAEALVDDNEVTVVDNLSNGARDNVPKGATFVQGDVRKQRVLSDLVADADLIFHEAAQVSVEKSIERPAESHETNVDATLSLLELARDHEVRIVLPSSAAVYGPPTSVPISESDPFDPTSPYGLEKLVVDHYARLYQDLYDVDTVILRYFNVYGPKGMTGDYAGVIGTFLEQARNGDPLTVHGDGSQTRDFIHVSDVVRANVEAAMTDCVGEAFNVGTGTETSIQNLAETIRDVTESPSEIVHTDPRESDVERSRADTTKAQERLDFEAKVDLRNGLEWLSTAHS